VLLGLFNFCWVSPVWGFFHRYGLFAGFGFEVSAFDFFVLFALRVLFGLFDTGGSSPGLFALLWVAAYRPCMCVQALDIVWGSQVEGLSLGVQS